MAIHTVSFLVENKAGVLFNVTNLFRRRGFNIESIAVGTVQDPKYSRMTISVDADAKTLANLVEQLEKMVEVIKVKRLDPLRTIQREMLLVKLSTQDPIAREDALKYINNQHGLVLDIDDDNIMAEVTGYPGELDEFLEYVKSIGIVELSRTGITALEKGRLKL
ncbi:acetolactate synthase small subunit [Candidatus Bathyarchaeota archaeon]|nr:acetolactate synthase small subunit [archaeon]RLI00526.1 MAG: acetolactate synthase small subunit [Candidatus Bathyarchaeota archaeon]HHL41813.1 acetolactate synthase small subunit [Candidatus Bathyarchaeota archaeon]